MNLRYFSRRWADRRWGVGHVPRILSGTEVERLLAAIPTTKHRAMGMLAYGAGLRVSEIARLESGDIDAKRMVLQVRNAKRGRERHVMLSPILLSALRAYWKDARPPRPRLFPGRDPAASHATTRLEVARALLVRGACPAAAPPQRLTEDDEGPANALGPVADLRRCPVCGANAVVRQPLPELHARAPPEAA
jgi:integrase